MISSILPVYSRTPFSFIKGKGSWLFDDNGIAYLDMGAGVAVNILGHAHPQLVKALSQQANNLWHTSNIYQITNQQTLADKLVKNTFADTVFFTNSGTEAMECAVKMARKFYHKSTHQRKEIITFSGAFHGRSLGMISAACDKSLSDGFEPLLPGFKSVEFGNFSALRQAINAHTAAVIIEPIQGEGGIRCADVKFLRKIRKLCNNNASLLILDEIQSGMGRSGRLFAYEMAAIKPDIMAIAKGIGGGFPLGACLATETVARAMKLGNHGSTFGGNPLACAVGNVVMDVVAQDDFLTKVRQRGDYLHQILVDLVRRYKDIFNAVRGVGLMLGLQCRIANKDIVQAGYQKQLLTIPARENVIRLLPPLNITFEDLDAAAQRLDAVAEHVRKEL